MLEIQSFASEAQPLGEVISTAQFHDVPAHLPELSPAVGSFAAFHPPGSHGIPGGKPQCERIGEADVGNGWQAPLRVRR